MAVRLAQAARAGFFRAVKRDVGDRDASSGGGIVGGDLHFAEGPDILGDLHDVLDLEFFDESAFFVMPADAHEGSEFHMHPDIDDLIVAGDSGGFIDADFVTGLSADVFLAFEFRVRPVEEAKGEIFVGEIGAGDGCDEFLGREFEGFSVDDFKKIESLIADAHVENPPGFFVIRELELDVLAFQEEHDRRLLVAFAEISAESFIEFGEGGGHPGAFEDCLGIGLLGGGGEGA